MSNFTNQVNVIFGAPGSGKSKLVRNLEKEWGAYKISYKDTMIPELCNMNQVAELYEFLSERALDKDSNTSHTAEETVLLQFCYEICSLINMSEPFKTIVFDGLPSTFDDNIANHIFALIEYLKEQNFTCFFVTSKPTRLKMLEERFGSELGKINT